MSSTQAPHESSPDFFSAQIMGARRFHLDLTPSRSERLVVVSGGCEQCAPDYVIRRNTFPYLGLEFVAQGRGTLDLAGHRHELQAGMLFSYGPSLAHEIRTDPDRCLAKYFVDFTGRDGLRLLREAGLSPGSIVQVAPPAQVMETFDQLIAAGLSGTRQVRRLCALLLETLIVRCADQRVPLGSLDTRAFVAYQRAREFINAHALTLRSLEEAAAGCHVSSAYLCRLFARFAGRSPYRVLTDLRMRAAAERLLAPGTLVKDVAGELGFSDPYHFSRVFKKSYGVAPENFVRLSGRSSGRASG